MKFVFDVSILVFNIIVVFHQNLRFNLLKIENNISQLQGTRIKSANFSFRYVNLRTVNLFLIAVR